MQYSANSHVSSDDVDIFFARSSSIWFHLKTQYIINFIRICLLSYLCLFKYYCLYLVTLLQGIVNLILLLSVIRPYIDRLPKRLLPKQESSPSLKISSLFCMCVCLCVRVVHLKRGIGSVRAKIVKKIPLKCGITNHRRSLFGSTRSPAQPAETRSNPR